MKLKKICIYLSATVLFLLISIMQLSAQDVPPSQCGDPDADCPIDTQVILLAAAVLFLSVKKIADTKFTVKNPIKEA